MKLPRFLVPAAAAATLLLAACGGSAAPSSGAAAASSAASAAVSASAAAPGSTAASISASASPSGSAASSTAPSASGAKPVIKIGSTNFSEQLVLGELYAQVLEANGFTVERHFNLGTREVVVPALESGQIDLEADYMATLLVFLDKNAKPSTDAATTAGLLKTALAAKSLTALDYAPAVDTNGFAVTKATADKYHLVNLSDLAPVASQMILGGAPECPKRPFCLPGLQSTYGIKFKDFKPLDAGGPLTVAALAANQIQVGELFTTDANISVKGFVLLNDDKHLQLSDNVAPIVRGSVLTAAGPTFSSAINSVSSKLTTAGLTGLNKQVGVDKQDPKTVAAAWLKAEGLVK